jgi:hypothetical protein
MVESTLVIVMHPRQDATLVLGLNGHDEILRASLGPPSQAHHQAAPMLLEKVHRAPPIIAVLSGDAIRSSCHRRLSVVALPCCRNTPHLQSA